MSYRPQGTKDYTLRAGVLHARLRGSAVRILLVALVTLVLGGCGGGEPGAGQESSGSTWPAEGPIRVVVTLAPLAWSVECQEFSRDVEVSVLLPDGVSPHGWEPSPSDALALSKAHMILVASDEDEAIVRRMGLSAEARLVNYGGSEAHIWLDRDSFAYLGVRVRNEIEEPAVPPLVSASGPTGPAYDRLRADDGLIAGAFVVTSHDAWTGYFAPFDCEVVAVRGHHHDEPSPSHLAEVKKRALEADKVLAVFEPGEPDPWLRALAEEVGAATVTLDPVGTRDWDGDMLKRDDAVVAALESLE